MSCEHHIFLLIDYKNGKPRKEPVHAMPLENGNWRLLFSPGFVRGIATGDELRLLSEDGEFEVIKRAGNVSVQLYSTTPFNNLERDRLETGVRHLGGKLDGSIEGGLVFTIPVSAGFRRIEELFNSFVGERPGTEWYYGNVYDEKNGNQPLNWWNSE
jgi:hypothetical protein